MLDPVFAAFSTTGFAELCAEAAQFLREPRPAAHEGRSAPANFGAISIEANAFGHHGHVALTQAGGRAVFAGFGTTDAGVDTTLEFLMAHRFLRG